MAGLPGFMTLQEARDSISMGTDLSGAQDDETWPRPGCEAFSSER
jgi:hypothetical protein